MSADSRLIGIGASVVVTAVLAAARALRRQHTVDKGKEARATVLHVQTVEPSGAMSQPYLLIQVAIPRGDGTEIVGVARAAYWSVDKMPEPGWTVPVYYRERLGTTTLVEIMGPPGRAARADPAA